MPGAVTRIKKYQSSVTPDIAISFPSDIDAKKFEITNKNCAKANNK